MSVLGVELCEVSTAANRYLGTMRGLDQFTRSVFDVPVIDHDFAPEHQPYESTPGSLLGFSKQLYNLTEEIPDDELNGDVMRRNLLSANFVIGVLSQKYIIGENIDHLDYVERVTDVRPSMVPETSGEEGVDSLESQRKEIESLVASMGYQYDPKDRDRFNNDHSIPAEEMQATVEGLINPAKEFLAPIVGTALMKGLDKVKIEVIESKDTWQAYFGTKERGEFLAQFNSNPYLKYSSLDELAAIVHELTHGVSSTNKQQRIAQGELSPGLGLPLGFSPSYFQEEVAARAVEESLLASQSGTSAEYVYKMMKYRNDVNNNMLIMANSGSSEAEVAEYGMDHMPFEEPGKIKRDAELYVHNLLYKTVFAVDGEALRAGRRIAALPEKAMRSTVVKLCSEPVETAELLAA